MFTVFRTVFRNRTRLPSKSRGVIYVVHGGEGGLKVYFLGVRGGTGVCKTKSGPCEVYFQDVRGGTGVCEIKADFSFSSRPVSRAAPFTPSCNVEVHGPIFT